MTQSPPTETLDLERLERLEKEATPGPWEAWGGRGWPTSWSEFTGISDQEVVWPVRVAGSGDDEPPVAVFASAVEQQRAVVLHNAAPQLLQAARRERAMGEFFRKHGQVVRGLISSALDEYEVPAALQLGRPRVEAADESLTALLKLIEESKGG